MMPHAEFGPNDHREDAPHFNAIDLFFELTAPPKIRRNDKFKSMLSQH